LNLLLLLRHTRGRMPSRKLPEEHTVTELMDY
jgi:hypothetical protein